MSYILSKKDKKAHYFKSRLGQQLTLAFYGYYATIQ